MTNGHPPRSKTCTIGRRVVGRSAVHLPWCRGRRRRAAGGGVPGPGGGCLCASVSGVCDGAERAAFAEFPHYGGVDLDPSPDFEGGTCAGFFDVQATHHEVLDYYRRQLRVHGWAVRAGEIHARGELEAGTLGASRGGFTYEVLYETGPAMIGGGTHLAIHVARA